MNDDKLALYESLIRASLILIFFVALMIGTVGLVAISQMVMRQALSTPGFLDSSAVAADTSR